MYQLISLFDDPAYFLHPIIEKYRTFSGKDVWLFHQLTELLSAFAADGERTAQDALFEKYDSLYKKLLNKKRFDSYDYVRDCFEFLTIVLLQDNPAQHQRLIFDYGKLFLTNPHYNLEREFTWFADRAERTIEKLPEILEANKSIPEWNSFYQAYLKKLAKEQAYLKKLAEEETESAIKPSLPNKSDMKPAQTLLSNYQESNKDLLLDTLSKLKIDYSDSSLWHEIVMAICDDSLELPREFYSFVYEKSLCSFCRYCAVHHMRKHQWLTPEMLEECQYDCNDDVIDEAQK